MNAPSNSISFIVVSYWSMPLVPGGSRSVVSLRLRTDALNGSGERERICNPVRVVGGERRGGRERLKNAIVVYTLKTHVYR